MQKPCANSLTYHQIKVKKKNESACGKPHLNMYMAGRGADCGAEAEL